MTSTSCAQMGYFVTKLARRILIPLKRLTFIFWIPSPGLWRSPQIVDWRRQFDALTFTTYYLRRLLLSKDANKVGGGGPNKQSRWSKHFFPLFFFLCHIIWVQTFSIQSIPDLDVLCGVRIEFCKNVMQRKLPLSTLFCPKRIFSWQRKLSL